MTRSKFWRSASATQLAIAAPQIDPCVTQSGHFADQGITAPLTETGFASPS